MESVGLKTEHVLVRMMWEMGWRIILDESAKIHYMHLLKYIIWVYGLLENKK